MARYINDIVGKNDNKSIESYIFKSDGQGTGCGKGCGYGFRFSNGTTNGNGCGKGSGKGTVYIKNLSFFMPFTPIEVLIKEAHE